MWVILVRDSNGRLRCKRNLYEGAVSIGRSSANDIVLDAPGVSRRHARIALRESQAWFEDLGGVNGSFIGGQRVRGAIPWRREQRLLIVGFTLDLEPDPERSGLPHLLVHDPDNPVTRPWNVDETLHWRSPAAQLDQQLRALRETRAAEREQAERQRARMDQDWQRLLRDAGALRERLRGTPRLLSFNVSEDAREVAVKLAASGSGGIAFLLTRRHPEHPAADREDLVWLRETGHDDAPFHDPPAALAELERRLAQRLG